MKYILIFLSSFIVFVANADPLAKDVNVVNTPQVDVRSMPPVEVTVPSTLDTNIINTPTVVIGNDASSPIPITFDDVGDSKPKINLIVADPNETNAFSFVNFYASISGGDAPLAYMWEFGDGHDARVKNASHTYDIPGFYIVTFTVIDQDGDVTTDAISIKVGEEDTQPSIDYITYTVPAMAGDAVDFDPILTGGNPPLSLHWEFGDGTTSSLQSTSHTYVQPGLYNATLLVTDVNGDSAMEIVPVLIDPRP